MTRGSFLALALALHCGPVLAQEGNSGLEQLTRREQTLGWEAVGRLDTGEGGFCTGTLIATDLVLTAAHCLHDGAEPADLSAMRFRAGLSGDRVVAEAGVRRAVVHPGYDPGADPDADSVGHDVALLELDQAIPAAVAAPFTVEAPGAGREVSVVSYALGRAEALSWQRSCAVKGRAEGLLAFDCEATFGASGAPVFDRSAGRASIVSIIVAGGDTDEGPLAFGMELPGLVADLKAALRSGRGVREAGQAAAPKVRRLSVGDGSRDIGARFVRP